MSGSTIVSRVGERFRITLETACIEFALDPDGTSPEADFHYRTHTRFEGVLDRVWPDLAAAVERAVAAAGLVTAPNGPSIRVWTSQWDERTKRSVGLDEMGYLDIHLSEPCGDDDALERLQAAVATELEALRAPAGTPRARPARPPTT